MKHHYKLFKNWLDCFAFARNDEKSYAIPNVATCVAPRNDVKNIPSPLGERVSEGQERGCQLDCAGTNVPRNDEYSMFPRPLGRGKKAAFTLAEVLITLGIVGVVSMLVLPSLLTNVNERINSHRQANIAYKITQATDKMKAMGLLNGSYATTDQFVDELQKHLRIAKRCDANHIADCWPTDKVITGDGKEFEVSKAKTGKNLNIKGNTSNNVGLVLADGASIILTYNQDSTGIDESDAIVAMKPAKTLPVGFGKFQEFPHYTTNTTGAIDFVMDVNGKKGPNSETRDNKYHDIRSFKAARFSSGCAGVEIAGKGCVVNLGTSYECIDGNCWYGAYKACEDIGMGLASNSALDIIFLERVNYPELPQEGKFWSRQPFSNGWYNVKFFSGGWEPGFLGAFEPTATGIGALCVGN